MTDASDEVWQVTPQRTQQWRQQVWQRALALKPRLVLTVGKWADKEFSDKQAGDIPVVRTSARFPRRFIRALAYSGAFGKRKLKPVTTPQSIPRAHLPYPMQAWMGTSGSRALRAIDHKVGRIYAIIAPKWVIDASDAPSKVAFFQEEQYVRKAKQRFQDLGFAPPGLATKHLADFETSKKKNSRRRRAR